MWGFKKKTEFYILHGRYLCRHVFIHKAPSIMSDSQAITINYAAGSMPPNLHSGVNYEIHAKVNCFSIAYYSWLFGF